MPWAALARVLDCVRVPIAAAAAVVCSLYLALGPFRWLMQARILLFAVWFVVAFAVIVVVLTALLAIAEHLAEQARARPALPFAIAGYRAGQHPDRAPRAPHRGTPRASHRGAPRPPHLASHHRPTTTLPS